MSTEGEAAGALIDAGLVAHQVEATRLAGGVDSHGACRNCGAALQGRFCHACGQGSHIHRSLLHLGEELLHGLFHFDAKGWRTLPLLIARPGLLTRRYIEGQRMRYVSPLALFLFTVFLMFFAASLTPSPPDVFAGSGDFASAKAEVRRDLENARAVVAKQQANVERIRERGGDAADAEEDLASAKADLAAAQTAVNAVAMAASAAAATAAPAAAAASAAAPSGSSIEPGWAQLLHRVKTGHPRFDAAVKHAADNPELTAYKLKNTAYKFSFMLVPISLPFLWLMFFWRRGIAMYDHAVFSLYSLTFMSLLVTVAALLYGTPARGFVAPLLILVPPVHLAVHLRETHGLTWSSTVWRTGVLLCVCLAALLLFLAAILALSMA